MCNTKPNCQTKAKAEQYEQEIIELKLKVQHYQTKQIAINDELLQYKLNGQNPQQTIDNLIALITKSN
jgi:hypothetical protein